MSYTLSLFIVPRDIKKSLSSEAKEVRLVAYQRSGDCYGHHQTFLNTQTQTDVRTRHK